MSVTWDNGFDLGTDGDTVTTAKIASSGSAFKIGGTGTAHFSAADAIDGARAIELVRASNTLVVFTNYALSTTDVSFSFFFIYKGSLPNATDYLVDARKGTTTTNSSIWRMLTNSSGMPFVQIAGATVATGATAFTVGYLYRCDVRSHIDSSAGSIHVDFYDPYGSTPLFTGFSLTSQNTGTANITDIFVGPSGANTVTVGTTVIDRPRIDVSQSSTYLGAPSTGHTGSATMSQTSTFGATVVSTRLPSITMSQTSTFGATSGNGPPKWDDVRYAWDSPAITWDGVTPPVNAAFSQTSTFGVVATSVHIVPPIPGTWRMSITKPYGALITITVGGS